MRASTQIILNSNPKSQIVVSLLLVWEPFESFKLWLKCRQLTHSDKIFRMNNEMMQRDFLSTQWGVVWIRSDSRQKLSAKGRGWSIELNILSISAVSKAFFYQKEASARDKIAHVKNANFGSHKYGKFSYPTLCLLFKLEINSNSIKSTCFLSSLCIH